MVATVAPPSSTLVECVMLGVIFKKSLITVFANIIGLSLSE